MPSDHAMYNPEVKDYDCDVDKAEELLVDLGYDQVNEDGIRYNEAGKELVFTIFIRGCTVRIAEILKEQLAEAGIGLEVQSAESQTHDGRLRNNEYELAIHSGGGWGGDPDYLRGRFMTPADDEEYVDTQSLGYENQELNQLLEEQRLELDEEMRQEIIFEIQEILAEDVPEIPLYHPAGYTAYRPDKYDGWMFMFAHHSLTHLKLSYLERGG
nr:ABC transporter substrate-binding protein [Natroniella acetigena]